MTHILRYQPSKLGFRLLLGTGLLVSTLLLTQRALFPTGTPYRYPFTSPQALDITGQLEQELVFYKTRIHQNPKDGLNQAALATVYLKLARATGDANWYLLAEQNAQQSLNNLPFNNTGALLAQAKVAEAQHNFDRAIELAQQVLTLQPRHEDALAILVTAHLGKGNPGEAAIAAEQLVETIPTLGTYTLRALAHIAQGQETKALQDFDRALSAEEPEEAGSSAWTRTLMGRFYASRGEVKKAEQLYREALRILPRYPLALTQSAQLKTRLGQYRTAEKLYNQVFIAQDYPNVWDHVALQGMAQTAALRGDSQRAEALWQQAEALFRQHQDLSTFGHRRELARLLLARGRDLDLPEALTLMEADLKVRRDVDTLDTYAWVLTRLGRWQTAQDILREAIATNHAGPQQAVIFYRAGRVEQQLGNAQQAETYFLKAQAVDPIFSERDRQIWGLE
ncbi:MAG: tetratricopeptide repeat protein [Cyanobacteria bacterium P01_D01_bin.44]